MTVMGYQALQWIFLNEKNTVKQSVCVSKRTQLLKHSCCLLHFYKYVLENFSSWKEKRTKEVIHIEIQGRGNASFPLCRTQSSFPYNFDKILGILGQEEPDSIF